MPSRQIFHPAAATQPVHMATSAETVTIVNSSVSGGTVWAGTNPLISVYPWLGTKILPGTTAVISAMPGQVTYTSAPNGAASLTIITST